MQTIVVDVETGEPVSVEVAYTHRDRKYRCSDCPCLVKIRPSSKGNLHAAKMPGSNHDPNCSTIGYENDGRFIQLENTDTDVLRRNILEAQKRSKGPRGQRHPGAPHRREQVTQLRTLRDIYTLGLYSQHDFALSSTVNLRDILVNQHTAIDMDLVHEDGGAKAVCCVPIRFIPEELVIRFRLADGSGDDLDKCYNLPIFDLQYSNRDTYWKDVRKLMRKEGQRYTSAYKMVMIYADWSSVPHEQYREIVTRYGRIDGVPHGYQKGKCIYTSRQIFKPVNRKIK